MCIEGQTICCESLPISQHVGARNQLLASKRTTFNRSGLATHALPRLLHMHAFFVCASFGMERGTLHQTTAVARKCHIPSQSPRRGAVCPDGMAGQARGGASTRGPFVHAYQHEKHELMGYGDFCLPLFEKAVYAGPRTGLMSGCCGATQSGLLEAGNRRWNLCPKGSKLSALCPFHFLDFCMAMLEFASHGCSGPKHDGIRGR